MGDIGIFINYIFIYNLPLEFFYIEAVYGLCGGDPIYFMGKLESFVKLTHSGDEVNLGTKLNKK